MGMVDVGNSVASDGILCSFDIALPGARCIHRYGVACALSTTSLLVPHGIPALVQHAEHCLLRADGSSSSSTSSILDEYVRVSQEMLDGLAMRWDNWTDLIDGCSIFGCILTVLLHCFSVKAYTHWSKKKSEKLKGEKQIKPIKGN